MFVFHRSAAAVLVPIALLLVVVMWSGRSSTISSTTQVESGSQATTVAQAGEPHVQGS